MLARHQFFAVDNEGNILAGATITVRQEAVGAPLAVLYTDRAGTSLAGNPVASDAAGYAYFHVVGGVYRIDVTKGDYTATYRYVGIGLASESDGQSLGVPFVFDSSTTDSDPGSGLLRLNNATLASVTKMFVSDDAASGADVSAWLATWDDNGVSANRGIVTMSARNNQALFIGRITGSVVDDTGYRDITVTPIASSGTFLAGDNVGVYFVTNGADGEGSGDVVGPDSSTTGNIATFDSDTGKLLADSGVDLSDISGAIAAVGIGKQLLAWVPAGAMISNTTNGAELVDVEMTTNKNMVRVLNFDPTTSESAQFSVAMPKKWNESTVTFVPYWTHDATDTNFGVVWELSGVATSNSDTLDVAFGTGQTSTDTGGTTYDVFVGPESAAITIGGTPAEVDLVNFKISRLPANGSDTMAVDAGLIGVKVFYTVNAVTEA